MRTRRRKRLLLDVDEVMADFLSPVFALVGASRGRAIGPHDFEGWDFFATLSAEERRDVFAEVSRPGWCASLAVKPGTEAALLHLRSIVDVYAVTKPFPSPTWVHERDRWLVERLGFTSEQIVHTGAKHICRGDAFLDDNPDNVVRWNEEHPKAVAMLWHSPNTRLLGHDHLRVHGWDDVVLRVSALVSAEGRHDDRREDHEGHEGHEGRHGTLRRILRRILGPGRA